MVPFCPGREPFQSYARNVRRFAGDLGVSRAVRYWQTGAIPEGFKWLQGPGERTRRNEDTDAREDHHIETGDAEATTAEPMPVRRKGVIRNHVDGGKGKGSSKRIPASPTTPSTKAKGKRTDTCPSDYANDDGAGPTPPFPPYRGPKRFHLLAPVLAANLPR